VLSHALPEWLPQNRIQQENLGNQRFDLHLRNGAGNKVWDNFTLNPDGFPCMDFAYFHGIERKYLCNNVH
jgi:hypothetical protein